MLKNDWKILIENLLKKVVKIEKNIKHMKCQKVVINICIIEEKRDKILITFISWRKKREKELNISFDN